MPRKFDLIHLMNIRHAAGLLLILALIVGCAGSESVQKTEQQSQRKDYSQPSDTLTASEMINAKSSYLKGLEEFEQENYEKALDYFTAAYIKLPNHSGVNYALADTYFQMGDLVNASYYGKQATTLEPYNKWYHLKLAHIYRNAGKNEATLKELNSILEHNPKDLDVLYLLANTYADYGEYLKSNKVYNRILTITGASININLQKFKNFNQLGMNDSAIAELKEVRRIDPDNINTMHTLSQFYIEQDSLNRAKDVLKKAYDRNTRDPKTLVMLADVYITKSQWDSAGTLLGSVVKDSLVAPGDKMEIAQYLYSRFKQDQRNKSLQNVTRQVLESFLEANPDYGMIHTLAADFYLATGDDQKALQSLERTNELMPDNDAAWKQRVQILFRNSNYEKVIEIGTKAEEHVPDDPFILFFVGNSYMIQGNNQEAAEWLRRASKVPARKQFKSAILGSLGDALNAIDKWEQSVEAYEEAIELDPENGTALNNYAYYLSTRDEKLEKARKMAQKALDASPGNPSFLDTMGWIYYKLEEYEKAREYIQRSLDTGSASATVLEHMGDVLEKLGKLEEAKSYWKRAYEKEPENKQHLKKKFSETS